MNPWPDIWQYVWPLVFFVPFFTTLALGRRGKSPLAAWCWSGRFALVGIAAAGVGLLQSVLTAGDSVRPPALFALVCVVILFAAVLRTQLRTEAAARAARGSRPSRPGFALQAFILLIPVALLAGTGIWALQRDRAMVGQEARVRAEEVAAQFAARLGRPWAGELASLEWYGNQWNGDGIIGMTKVFAPGEWPANASPREAYEQQLAAWRESFKEWQPADLLPVQLDFTPQAAAPVPPEWRTRLEPAASAAWESVDASTHGTNFPGAQSRFLGLNPPAEARANLQLIGFRRAARQPGVTAESRATLARALLEFSESPTNQTALTATGLPLASVAILQGLKLVAPADFDVDWFRVVSRELFQRPSLLSPLVLEEAARLAARRDAAWKRAVEGLRERWTSAVRRRALTARLTELVSPDSHTVTNVWLDRGGERWLAMVHPITVTTLSAGNPPTRTEVTVPATRVFPRRYLEQSLNRAARELLAGIPPWLGVEVVLEGDSLGPVTPTASTRPGTPASLLASATGVLDRIGAESGGNQAPYLESKPRFVARVFLADAALLYARQKQRQWVFLGLIAASVLAAIVGVLQSRRSLLQQVALAEQKTNFVSSVSHELRAPIASVRLLAESLERGAAGGPERQREYHGLIVRECRRLTALINNVLDVARIDQGHREYEFEPTDVGRLVAETVRLMQPAAEDHRVTLQCEMPPLVSASPADAGAAPILDGAAVQRALVNLIDNALKHSPESTTVTVRLELPDTGPTAGVRHLRFIVEDQGPGIPPTERERIFERFQRLGSELRRETPGVGLGLAIVRHIVEAHRGRVWVEDAPVKGSRFVIELPAPCRES